MNVQAEAKEFFEDFHHKSELNELKGFADWNIFMGYIILLIQAHHESLETPPCNQFDPVIACVK
ncbi:hypothetical protein KI387_043590, partial [Taxus chinensis]